MTSPRSLRLLALLALAGSPTLALAQDEPTTGATAQADTDDSGLPPSVDADEWAAFNATRGRYEARMSSFEDDARAYAAELAQQERERLTSGYDEAIAELESQQDALRVEAIDRFEAFLRKYPNSEHSAHAMFRLGDLYYERTEAEYLVAQDEYERVMADFDFETATEFPEAPMKDYSKSIALYERIIAQHPDYRYADGAYYMLGFCLARDQSLQFDEVRSHETFTQLVEKHPDSQFAAAAHLRLGEYYFDYATNEAEIAMAIPHYEKVLELAGEDGELYDDGLYKLAWSHYKLNHYDEALRLFTQLLDWSEQSFLKTGFEAPTKPEAIEYIAISFSDVSDNTFESPLAEAQGFYQRVGARDHEKDVYARLASVLQDQARFEDAIDVYTYLQDRWPDDPENPNHQWRIAQIHYYVDQPELANQAIAELTEKYNDESTWWVANRNDPDAQAVARSYIEKSLAAVATGYHNEGIETGDKEAFARAAELYGDYLKRFPFAEDYYEIQWYRADTLMQTEQYDKAEEEYVQLLKADGHEFRDGSLWNLMQVRRNRLVERYGSFDKRPDDAPVKERIPLESGDERIVYALSDDHLAFIDTTTQLLDADLKNPDYREALEQNEVPLKYLIAQLYFHHGQFDKARPRLEDLIQNHPEWDEASYAATMMINSYQAEQDLQQVKELALRYRGLALGGGKKDLTDFENIAEQAAFKQAEALIKVDRIQAAEAFEAFRREFPRSKYIADAHYNAANSYEIAGRIDDANRLFQEYIDNIESGRYAQDDRARALYFRIANNYADVLELEKAIKYYESLYRRFPGADGAKDALYNAAFLRIGLQDHRGAAENFENYAGLSPTPDDAEQVMFAAGAQWELVSDDSATEFYRRYLRRYPSASSDRAMEAWYRIADLTEKQGKKAATDKAWKDLAQGFRDLTEAGPIGPRGRHYAAMAAVRDLQVQFDEFAKIEFSRKEEKNVELLLETKPKQLKDIDEEATRIVNVYADFDGSSAALYFLGRAYLRYSDMLYEAPPPKGLDEEGKAIYYEEIDKRRLPVEDKGRARLEAGVTKAKEAGQWNEWVSKTIDFLADRYPSDFSPEKQEIRAEGESAIVPRAGPLELRPQAKSEGTEAGGEK
ncbi:MAG: tetratricopeptide repeat protein [Alphaproteobacteria bacterium]|nr:tetratricopeptide repeat protein [Alphaproteobacteria bacterium]